MSEKQVKKNKNYSRKSFLKSAGYIIGGAATLGIGSVVLTGCEVNQTCRASDGNNLASQASDVEYFGECVCTECYTSMPHPRGVPCRTISCPRCGTLMVRGLSN
jgi:hypothetical protein